MQNKPRSDIEPDWSIRYHRFWLMNYMPDSILAFLVLIPFCMLMAGIFIAGDRAATLFGMPFLRTAGGLGTMLVALYLVHFMDRRCDDPVLPWNR